MSRPYDIFLVCAQKDYAKLPFVLTGLMENLEGWEEIHLCTPSPVKVAGLPIHYHRDGQIIPHRWLLEMGYRPGWVYQQFLKLFQHETKNDLYLTVDCDVVMLRPLPLFNAKGLPIWWVGQDQNHGPYYRFSQKMVGVGRRYDHTFLADMNFFYRPFITEMLHETNYGSMNNFMYTAIEVIGDNCYPSEADLYMQWVMLRHPDFYAVHKLKTAWQGRHMAQPWTLQEMAAWIRKKRAEGLQTTGIHSYAD